MEDFNPEGLHILAIDADENSLKHLQTLLLESKYQVTATTFVTEALHLIRDKNNKFDMIMTDVVHTGIDGFKLLEIINLEIDIPVIIVSADNQTQSILKALSYGVKDYLSKPVRTQEIQLIWKHVYRRKLCWGQKCSSSKDNKDHIVRSVSTKEEIETILKPKPDNHIHGQKKRRVKWTPELHARFVAAYEIVKGGINSRRHPKKILEVMNVAGLTREHIASHLQKYRHSRKKDEEVRQSIGATGQPQLRSSNETIAQGMCHNNAHPSFDTSLFNTVSYGNFPYEHMRHGYGYGYGYEMFQKNTMFLQPPTTLNYDPRMEHNYREMASTSSGIFQGTEFVECAKDNNIKGHVEREELMKYGKAEDKSMMNGVEDVASSSQLDVDLCGFASLERLVDDLSPSQH